ncbi:putative colanic acid biosynthesis acetyltransferase [Cyanobium sp. AMD-g]|uniref:DapH/DapD/GlmU-related protein n=1 Tax=Cyanobium sp. AMD-g TaxID=2823699 RepID=UPI0020CBDA26|nr:DapH/DapD/GlmU-related protein [Cyanobium sp. AMD-g]MCP9929758.1 putative colanic acid biosynthesis acetyltransferase [Cyanobium sp. AMD-g]
MADLQTHSQASRYASPWSFRYRLRILLWEYTWLLLCTWTPKPFNPWRLLILQCFGTTIHGEPFVHQRARIEHPWNLTLHHKACLGDRAHAYCLGKVEIHTGACVAQEAYLCTGTHDFKLFDRPLQTAPISIRRDAFIGARAFLLPGVTVGEGAIVGACSVVTRQVPPATLVAGNPARFLADVPRA